MSKQRTSPQGFPPLPEKFRVTLTMNSDWHVGSGVGRPGSVDRVVARDADGLPFVPAKTLCGIWRDACERLCRGLDNGHSGDWCQWVDYIFGSQPSLATGTNGGASRGPTRYHDDPRLPPIPSAIQVGPARMSAALRERLTELPGEPSKASEVLKTQRRLLREAATFVKPGVMIDRNTGSAVDDNLRFEEMARVGTVLEAECVIDGEPEFRAVASILLIASAQLVERLGGKRRRGAGKCQLNILDADVNSAINWLENDKNEQAPLRPTRAAETPFPVGRHSAADNDPWVAVRMVLKLQDPLAVSYRTIGNVVETLDYLPGSYLLPHVTRALTAAGVQDVRAAIQAGDVCVWAATPEVDGVRGEPVPMALFAPKEGKGLADRATIVNRLLQTEQDDTQRKQMREGYLRPDAPNRVVRTRKQMRTHNTVQDEFQRPTSDVGGVYSYEAIAPMDSGRPVRLCSELRLRKSLVAQLADGWWKQLEGTITLGRSRKDDYGTVNIEAAPAVEIPPHLGVVGDELFVWLVSDTLIRDSQLRPGANAATLSHELGRRLGVEIKLRESNDGRLDEVVRTRRLDSWHVGWGLPRPSLVALQAGSCMVFRVNGTIEAGRLAALESSGIGERTAEGYGRIRFNHPLVTQLPSEWPAEECAGAAIPNAAPPPIRRADPVFAFAEGLETECWKREIRRACLAIAADSTKRKEMLGWNSRRDQGQPPMSQLGALRGQLARLRSFTDHKSVDDWFEHLKKTARRAERWPSDSIAKVRELISKSHRIWEKIETAGFPTITEGAESQLRTKLWAFAVRTFFDACIRAHKREVEKLQRREEA